MDKKGRAEQIDRAEDKMVRYSFWEGEIACSIHACPTLRHYSKVVMRGTVNTFYRGSSPLNAYLDIRGIRFFFLLILREKSSAPSIGAAEVYIYPTV